MARRRRRNPLAALPEKQAEYLYYVGTILSPKAKIPAAVYVSGSNPHAFYVFTPDKELGIGAGYYGDEDGPEGCIRQHMLPGLLSTVDQGTGLGTALYIAGNMVVAASQQDASGAFPWGVNSEQCTYSTQSERSYAASRAWDNMRKHGLSEEGTGGEGESENLEFEYELDDDDVSTDHWEENFREYYADEYEDVEVDSTSVSGTVSISGTGTKEGTADIMQWDTIKESGLVMHLGGLFDDGDDHMFIPPRVFASADWSNTPDDWIVDFANQNAEAAKAYTDKGASGADWIREAACFFGRGTTHGELLLEIIGEQSQLPLPHTKRYANETCPTTFAREARVWEDKFGEDYEEGDFEEEVSEETGRDAPRPKRLAKKSKRPAKALAVGRLKAKLLR